jgi:hypothetical protein
MGDQQGIAGDVRSHLLVTQDEMRQHGEHRFARSALNPPDGETVQADTGVMGVTCQAPTTVTSPLVFEREAKRKDEGEDKLDRRFAPR